VNTLGSRYEGAIQKKDLLGAAKKGRDGKVDPPRVTGPLTFLVIGSDSREGANANRQTRDGNAKAVPGERSDTIMLVHVPPATDRAYVISLPRDMYVPIVEKNGRPGPKNRINHAFANGGGAERLVMTVNHLTGGRVDYPVIVNFNAVRKITDLVGGVEVVVDKTNYDPYRFMPKDTRYATAPCRDKTGRRQRCVLFKAGRLKLDGQLAEYYVRQRDGLLRGDLDRAKRQQQYMRALMTKAAASGFLSNPLKFDELVRTGAGAVTVDTSMPVQSVAFSLKGLRPADLTFMTVPIAADRRVANMDVLIPAQAQTRELFTALNTDTLDRYVLKYPPNDVSHGA
jgi:LCP family protein required for cell wall assembly